MDLIIEVPCKIIVKRKRTSRCNSVDVNYLSNDALVCLIIS